MIAKKDKVDEFFRQHFLLDIFFRLSLCGLPSEQFYVLFPGVTENFCLLIDSN